MQDESILWRRLDAPGHDACRLVAESGGWRLEGTSVFLYGGVPAAVAYGVDCDNRWRTRTGELRGWMGARRLDLRIVRAPDGRWLVNDREVSGLESCLDLDLGFTPATNLFQLRRVALEVGQAASVPVAWLDVPDGGLALLHQRYERRSASEYWYESPRFDYFALLSVGAAGFVERYPDLWEVEAPDRDGGRLRRNP